MQIFPLIDFLALKIDGTNSPIASINWGGQNITNMGNITGTDVDISAGTGDYSSSGTITATGRTTRALSGLVSISTGFNTISDFGGGTDFLNEMVIGDTINVNGEAQEIATIINAALATIVGIWGQGFDGAATIDIADATLSNGIIALGNNTLSGLRYTGDLDTGLRRSGDNKQEIICGGDVVATWAVGGMTVDTNTLVVDAVNHWVGIGTASPGTILDVVNPSGISSAYVARIQNLNDADGQEGLLINIARNTGNTPGTSALNVQTGGTSRLYVANYGTVGINTTNPSSFFEFVVKGKMSVLTSITMGGNTEKITSGWGLIFDGGSLVRPTKIANTALLVGFTSSNQSFPAGDLYVSGNVGIGTTGPDRKLDVLDATDPQLRLTHTDGSVYTEFQTDASGNTLFTNTGGLFDFTGTVQVTGTTRPLTGTVDGGTGGNTLTSSATNTLFLSELVVGDTINTAGESPQVIATIVSNISATIAGTWADTFGPESATIDIADATLSNGIIALGAGRLTGLRYFGDPDTGIRRSGDDEQEIIAGGNVVATWGVDEQNIWAGQNEVLRLNRVGATGGSRLGFIGGSADWWKIGTVASPINGFLIRDETNNANRLIIDSSGNFDFQAGDLTTTGTLSIGGASNKTQISATGDVTFVGGAGLVYGGISTVENAVETSIASSGVKVQVTIFNRDMPSNNITPDNAEDHILITKAGAYRILVSATVNSIGGAGSILELEVMKNNGASRLGDLHADRTLGGGGTERGSIGLSDIVTLAAPVVATRTTYAFVDSNPDTVTDSSNNFVADGFAVGQTLTIAGSTSNDGNYTIDTVAVGTLTLIAADTLVAEVAGDTVTLTGSETVELWIENETNTQNYIVEDVTLSLVQLGGA